MSDWSAVIAGWPNVFRVLAAVTTMACIVFVIIARRRQHRQQKPGQRR